LFCSQRFVTSCSEIKKYLLISGMFIITLEEAQAVDDLTSGVRMTSRTSLSNRMMSKPFR